MRFSENTNLAQKKNYKEKGIWSRSINLAVTVFLLLMPWIAIPNSNRPLELYRENFLFFCTSLFFLIWFLRMLEKKEIEWRRTTLNIPIIGWFLILTILFLYSSNYLAYWQGYPNSLTGGLSEYVSFFLIYFLVTQLLESREWEKRILLFLLSVSASLIFYILAAIYFKDNSLLTINFAKTPTLVAAASGVISLSFWFETKKVETLKKGYFLILTLIFFFITSLLDFHLSWWMWFGGTLVLILFDLLNKFRVYKKEKEEKKLGFIKKGNGLLGLILRGNAKFLFLILAFSFSRAMSPIFLGSKKLIFMPYYNYLDRYPVLGQKVFFYILFNCLIILLGIYYYFRNKERKNIIIVIGSLVGVTVAYLIYYSESVILYFLNWAIIIFATLTFLRKVPERDYLFSFVKSPKAKIILIFLGIFFSILLALLNIYKIS